MATRPSRDQTFMEVARVFARRSTCRRGQVGAVLVRDRRIIATGYNGAPSGARNCLELGCLVPEDNPDLGCQRSIHAEANVIAYTARSQGGAEGTTLYSTASPCLKCAQLIAAAGIEKVIYENPYRITDGLELLDSLFIPCIQFAWTPIESDKNDRA